MYMQSNQPYNKADSVFNGALTGAAVGAMGMGALHVWGDNAENGLKSLKDKSRTKMTEASSTMRKNTRAAQDQSIQKNMQNSALSLDEVQTKAIEAGKSSVAGSKEMKTFKNQQRINKGAGQVNKVVSAGTKQLGSGKGKAMMYGGSVIAGALVGGLADGAN